MMKKLNLIVALVASVLLLGSCLKGGDPQPQLVGGTTFVNAFIEADAVYCYIDRNTVSSLSPLPYRSYGPNPPVYAYPGEDRRLRSEEHTSELQSLMRISYAVFCLKKKKNNNKTTN